jgi:hypothetical protein
VLGGLVQSVSILKTLDLPPQFGVLVLSFAFILLVAPYFAGLDFGVFKVPEFSQGLRRRLVLLGPICFALAVIVHIPILRSAVGPIPPPAIDSSDQEKTQSRYEEPLKQQHNSPVTRPDEVQYPKPHLRSVLSTPNDTLKTQLEKYLVELDKIEHNWVKEHASVVPLAERVAAVIKTKYPESAEKIMAAKSLPMSENVAAAVRVEVQKILEQLNVERHE